MPALAGLDYQGVPAPGELQRDVELVDDQGRLVVGIVGVMYFLHQYRGVITQELTDLETAYRTALKSLAMVTGRDRVTPRTTSILVPNPEQRDIEVVRPDFDRRHFDDTVLNPPVGLPSLSRPQREST